MFLPVLGSLYSWLINAFELLAVGVLLVCVIFLLRRTLLKVQRFMKRDLDGWPRTDAHVILITEIALMSLFLTMSAADRALQLQGHPAYNNTGSFLFSGMLANAFEWHEF